MGVLGALDLARGAFAFLVEHIGQHDGGSLGCEQSAFGRALSLRPAASRDEGDQARQIIHISHFDSPRLLVVAS